MFLPGPKSLFVIDFSYFLPIPKEEVEHEPRQYSFQMKPSCALKEGTDTSQPGSATLETRSVGKRWISWC
jgi:hypothetical protein